MEIVILGLLFASLICVYVTVRKLSDRFYDEIADIEDQTVTNFDVLGELDTKIRNETDDLTKQMEQLKAEFETKVKELSGQIAELKKQVDEIPVEQLQTVYDSEKQFQDGLNAIMSYGQQYFSKTERMRND